MSQASGFALPIVLVLTAASEGQETPLQAPWPKAAQPLELRKAKLLDLPDVGDVSDLRLSGEELIVAGTCGVARVSLQARRLLASAAYALPCPPYLDGRIADVDGDGRLEIARFDAGWVGPVAVLELDGSLRWSRDVSARADVLVDTDGDGRLEFLVEQPNAEEVELLDHRGEVRWKRAWGHRQFGLADLDVDADGKRELLYADGKGVQICDAAGEHQRTLDPPRKGYVNSLEKIAGMPELDAARLVVGAYVKGSGQLWWAYDERLQLLRAVPRGETIFEQARDDRVSLEHEPALFLSTALEKHQAAPAGFSASWLRIFLFDTKGTCVFDDPLAPGQAPLSKGRGAHLVLATQPLRLLVGYGATLWEYRE